MSFSAYVERFRVRNITFSQQLELKAIYNLLEIEPESVIVTPLTELILFNNPD